MEDNLSANGGIGPFYYGLGPKRCAVCASKSGLLNCGGCKAVTYCGTAHQLAHRSTHRATCTAIKKSREALEREEAALRANPGEPFMPTDVFNTSVGRFWGILGTRDYMRARFAAADALLKVDTVTAVEKALEHFTDMLRLCRSDNMGVRDVIPDLLLRLGREQECYDFLKWWAVIDDKDHYNGHYNWGDVTLPYLDMRGANAFEPVDIFCSGNSSLNHLVSLTLLKLRICLDLEVFEEPDWLKFGDRRPVGKLVQAKMRRSKRLNVSTTVEALRNQYRRLCRVVKDANPYFWEALVDEREDVYSMPPFYSPGSIEEADLALHRCERAWEESVDALGMIDSDTSQFTRVYEGSVTVNAGAGDPSSKGPETRAESMEKRRATGDVFPSRFKSPLATSSPAELFPLTPVGHRQTDRFVCRNDGRKVLAYADGACANNGQPEPRAGWAVVYGKQESRVSSLCVASGRLENKGPFGDDSVATSNRAELRAAIAVLRLCDWRGEGFDSVVIATDSSYVVDGATGWVKGWVRNGWKTRTGSDVKNRDLWDLLLGEVERWKDHGLHVELWKIPRELNGDADAAAKEATDRPAEVEMRDVVIRPPQSTTAGTEPDPPQTTARTESGPPRILALCLENEALFDSVFGSLVSHITSKAKMERATTQEAAFSMLSQEPPPSVILVIDGALTRRRKVWDRVIDRLREGATVVLAGCFSSMVSEGQFTRFFARLGLPWKRGSYHRTTVNLCRGVVDGHLTSRLPSTYSQKALFVRNVERSAAWYSSGDTSDEAAVVFAKIGLGKLGYIGDVNGEESSDLVVLAMCGLLD